MMFALGSSLLTYYSTHPQLVIYSQRDRLPCMPKSDSRDKKDTPNETRGRSDSKRVVAVCCVPSCSFMCSATMGKDCVWVVGKNVHGHTCGPHSLEMQHRRESAALVQVLLLFFHAIYYPSLYSPVLVRFCRSATRALPPTSLCCFSMGISWLLRMTEPSTVR
jgi:hypothetical protein